MMFLPNRGTDMMCQSNFGGKLIIFLKNIEYYYFGFNLLSFWMPIYCNLNLDFYFIILDFLGACSWIFVFYFC